MGARPLDLRGADLGRDVSSAQKEPAQHDAECLNGSDGRDRYAGGDESRLDGTCVWCEGNGGTAHGLPPKLGSNSSPSTSSVAANSFGRMNIIRKYKHKPVLPHSPVGRCLSNYSASSGQQKSRGGNTRRGFLFNCGDASRIGYRERRMFRPWQAWRRPTLPSLEA